MYNMEITFGSYKIRLEILLILIFLVWVIFGHALCSCCTMSLREGLETITGSGTQDADALAVEEEKKKAAQAVSTETGTTNPAVIMDEETEPFANISDVYGSDDKFNSMDIMSKMEFKPECCPNAYTTSQGCACMSNDTYHFLIDRGGNNVPYSEY